MTAAEAGQSTLDAWHRSLIWALMIVVVAAVIVCTAVVLIDPGHRTSESICSTAALLPLSTGAWLAALSVIRRGKSRDLMILSMILTGGGCVVLVAGMWHLALTDRHPNQNLNKLGLAAFLGGLALAHSGAMFSLVPTRTVLLKFSRAIVVVMVWLLVALVILTLLLEDVIQNSMGTMLFMVMVYSMLGFGSVLGTIIVPVAAISHANRRVERDQALDTRMRLTLACPNCEERQTLRAGFNRCAKCKASLFIELEEPRCECGYLLYRLVGDTCPECGRRHSSSQSDRPAVGHSHEASIAPTDLEDS